jgi:hypothetical protein
MFKRGNARMFKKVFLLVAMAMLVFSSFGSAMAYTIEDNIREYGQNGQGGGQGWRSTAIQAPNGPYFDTLGINVVFDGDKVIFELHTLFDAVGGNAGDGRVLMGSANVYLADLALDTNNDGNYDKAIVLKDHAQWTGGPKPAGFNSYGVGLYSVDAWYTSHNFFHGQSRHLTYGYGWGTMDSNTVNQAQVAVKQGELLDTAAVNWASQGTHGVWTVEVALASLDLQSDVLGLYWGTASCGNDSIAGTVTVGVPEPNTALLLGGVLMGLGAISRRRLLK